MSDDDGNFENSDDEIDSLEELQDEFDETEGELDAIEAVQQVRGKNTVHKSKLRDLIGDWRDEQEVLSENGQHALASHVKFCADQLESLVEDG
jgi:hypothetical protein